MTRYVTSFIKSDALRHGPRLRRKAPRIDSDHSRPVGHSRTPVVLTLGRPGDPLPYPPARDGRQIPGSLWKDLDQLDRPGQVEHLEATHGGIVEAELGVIHANQANTRTCRPRSTDSKSDSSWIRFFRVVLVELMRGPGRGEGCLEEWARG